MFIFIVRLMGVVQDFAFRNFNIDNTELDNNKDNIEFIFNIPFT